MLYNNKKFHFRCYALLTGDIRTYIHKHCFILTSSLDYDTQFVTDANTYIHTLRKHITNLSINKRFDNHPGQIPCDLLAEYPQVESPHLLGCLNYSLRRWCEV
jgi:hypothetical protein